MIYLRDKISKYESLIKYLSYSIFVTFIDVFLVWLLMTFLGVQIIYANTIGVITGFIVHYFLASKSVFNVEYGIMGFLVYIGTFIIGLAMADFIVYLSYKNVFYFLGKDTNFLFSKGASIVAPFFILYFMRKYIYALIGKYYEKRGGSDY